MINGLDSELRTITAWNLVRGYDMFIDTLLIRMHTDHQEEMFLLKELIIAMARKKEAELLAEEERQELCTSKIF